MTDAPPPPATADLQSTLEGVRASMAAQRKEKGIYARLQRAMLRLLERLLVLLLELRADAPADAAPGPEMAAAAALAACGPEAGCGEIESLTNSPPLSSPSRAEEAASRSRCNRSRSGAASAASSDDESATAGAGDAEVAPRFSPGSKPQGEPARQRSAHIRIADCAAARVRGPRLHPGYSIVSRATMRSVSSRKARDGPVSKNRLREPAFWRALFVPTS